MIGLTCQAVFMVQLGRTAQSTTAHTTDSSRPLPTCPACSCLTGPLLSWGLTMRRLVNDSQYIDCAVALGEITITSARMQTGLQVR